MDRVRAAILATNLPLLLNGNTWVYKTTSGTFGNGNVKRQMHYNTTLEDSDSDEDCVKLSWNKFRGSIYSMPRKQRTQDWFLLCLFRFTSTSFHACINVRNADYINSVSL